MSKISAGTRQELVVAVAERYRARTAAVRAGPSAGFRGQGRRTGGRKMGANSDYRRAAELVRRRDGTIMLR